MTLSELCIRRPVFAAVISLLIVAIGLVTLQRLPVRELPDVDTATITVSVTYQGAAPEVINTQVTETIEGAISGISGIRTINSTARRGSSRTAIEFETGVDIEAAANDVRGAVARIVAQLPEEADEPRVFKNDSNDDPIMRIALISDRMSPSQLTDFAERYLIDRLSTVDGVASVEIFGDRAYAMRIWLDRRALAARELTVADVETALRANNLELPAGDIVSVNRQFQVRTDTRLSTVEEFEAIVVRKVGDFPIRLGEVAQIEVGVENDDTIVRTEGRNAVGLGVLRQSQSNTVAISNRVQAELEFIRPTLPEGMQVVVGSDDAVFIEQSIREVTKTLGIAVVLVIIVIFLFIGSPQATLVPAVTIPVAVIGAFIGIFAFGFSINILTLFALILAIGIVVDDAIVVLENIARRVAAGEPPVVAGVRGSKEVTFAVIATSLTLMAVFVPISFLEGQVGRLFTEFGIVLAVAVGVSTLVALTLCPVLCVLFLRKGKAGILERLVNGLFSLINAVYRRLLILALNGSYFVILTALAIAGAAYFLFQDVSQELTPREDRGVFFVIVTGPQGSTVEATDREAREIEKILQPLLDEGVADRVFSIVGFRNQPHRAFVVARLVDWSERDQRSQEIVRSLIPRIVSVPGARAFPVQPSGLGLRGSRTPLQVVVGGPDFESVQEWSATLEELMQANPSLQNVESNFEDTQPEVRLSINRALADDLGISVEQIASTLQTMFASREVTEYIDRGREYPVIVQASDADRQSAQDLTNIFVRSSNSDDLIPLSALVSTQETTASPELNRYNRLPSITISSAVADDYDLGEAIAFVRETARDALPEEAQINFDGQSKEFLETSSGVAVTFVFALILVYLVLAAQFESFVHPATIMLTVPLSLTGALATLAWTGISLNVYTQIGMILLIGLMAKNGILIVEFANQLRDRGMEIREAVVEASVLRLRPIIMTVLSTVLGAVPLVIATGAGSESRQAIGVVIIGGFGFASLLTLFLTPVLYNLLARFTRPRGAVEQELRQALEQDRTPPTAPAE